MQQRPAYPYDPPPARLGGTGLHQPMLYHHGYPHYSPLQNGPPRGQFQQPFVNRIAEGANTRFKGSQQPQYSTENSSNPVNDAFLAFHQRQQMQQHQEPDRPSDTLGRSTQSASVPAGPLSDAANIYPLPPPREATRQNLGSALVNNAIPAAPRSMTGEQPGRGMHVKHSRGRGRGSPGPPVRGQPLNVARGAGFHRGSVRGGPPFIARPHAHSHVASPSAAHPQNPAPANQPADPAPAPASEKDRDVDQPVDNKSVSATPIASRGSDSRGRGRGAGRLFDTRRGGPSPAFRGGHGDLRNARTTAVPSQPARGVRERYDADFDRGSSSRKEAAEGTKQLFEAPIGYKANAKASPAILSETRQPVTAQLAVAENSQPAESDSGGDEAGEPEKLLVRSKGEDQQTAPRAGIIQRSIGDLVPAPPRQEKGKGKQSKQEKPKRIKGQENRPDSRQGWVSDGAGHGDMQRNERRSAKQDDRHSRSGSNLQTHSSPHLSQAALPAPLTELRQTPHASPRPRSRDAKIPSMSSPVPPARQLPYLLSGHRDTSEALQLSARQDFVQEPQARPQSPREIMRAKLRLQASPRPPDASLPAFPAFPNLNKPDSLRDHEMTDLASRTSGNEAHVHAHAKVDRPPAGHPLLAKIDTDPLLSEIRIAEADETSQTPRIMELLRNLEETRIDILCEQVRLAKVVKALAVPPDALAQMESGDALRAVIATIGEYRNFAALYRGFLAQVCDTLLPASCRAYLDTRQLPSELWQRAFLPPLDCLQQLIGRAKLSTSEGATRNDSLGGGDDVEISSLLEIYTDFLIFGYQFYADLLDERPLSRGWVPEWQIALGEIALHRVTALELRMHSLDVADSAITHDITPGITEASSKQDNREHRNKPTKGERKIKQKAGILRPPQQAKTPAKVDRSELEDIDSPAGNSIGIAALDDWVLHEEDIWRKNARECFFRAVHAEPGNGRVHALLAQAWQKDAILQRLYHLSRSLVVRTRYQSSENDLMALYTDLPQSYRLSSSDSVSLMLRAWSSCQGTKGGARIDGNLAQILEELSKRIPGKPSPSSRVKPGVLDLSESTWIMLAVISIASLLRPESTYAPFVSSLETNATSSDTLTSSKRECSNHSQLVNGVKAMSLRQNPDNVMRNEAGTNETHSPEAEAAVRVFCTLLELTIAMACKSSGQIDRPSPVWPYITLALTFLVHGLAEASFRSYIGADLPWSALINLFDNMPDECAKAIPTLRSHRHPQGQPLPEDWCIRGSAWAEGGRRRLFSEGFWSINAKQQAPSQFPASEADALDEHFEATSMPAHAGGPGPGTGPSASSETAEKPGAEGAAGDNSRAVYLTQLRWNRIAWCAARMCKKVPGLRFDAVLSKVRMTRAMRQRIGLANGDDENDLDIGPEEGDLPESESSDSADEAALVRNVSEGGNGSAADGASTSKQETAAVEDFPSLQQSKASLISKPSTHTRWENDTAVYAVPGYTSIIFDAQLLLGRFSLVSSMLQSKRWIVVIPLAVITELDRIAKAGTAGGDNQAASAVLAALEQFIKTSSSVLKIQTSRGNYLRDLSLRAEDLEFSAPNSAPGASNSAQHSHSKIPRGLDDVVVAAGKWQVDNWLDRRQLLLPGVLTPEERTRKLEGKWREAKVLLVSDNKILRAQGRAKGLSVASFQELEKVIQADSQTDYPGT